MSKKTIEQLKQELREAEEAEKKERELERKNFESTREDLINELAEKAAVISGVMGEFKIEAITSLNDFRQLLLKYGELRGREKNKGNFELKNDNYKIQFTSQIIKKFDERAMAAEKHINEFLKSFLRKKDKGTFELITGLLKRDEETGQFDIDMINRLYKYEQSFDDPNWKKGIALFKEAYQPTGTTQYVRFFTKNKETGGWDTLILDFAKMKVASEREKEVDDEES